MDRREAATCAHVPIAGDCWAIGEATLTASAHASAAGRSASCRLRCRSEADSVFALFDDGTYVAEAGRIIAGCSGGIVVTVPAEVGRISAGRRGSLLLTPDDPAALQDALQRCLGKPLVLKDYRTRVRVAADRATLNGVSKLRYRLRDRVPVDGSEVVRFRATRRPATPTAVARTAARARPPICSADLRPKCVQY